MKKKFHKMESLFFVLFTILLPGVNGEILNPLKELSPDYSQIEEELVQNEEQLVDEKYLNLEKTAQDFVLELKELIFPGFPGAFNPSVTRWKEKILVCFRIRTKKTTHEIGFVWVDENFNQISKPSVLSLPPHPSTSFNLQQDPRLITIGDRLYMVYSNIIPGAKIAQVRRVFVTEIHFDGNAFYADPPEYLAKFEGENEARWEKNWTPFVYNDRLLLGYSITPHRIFQIDEPSRCSTIASSLGLISWDWGFLRGGTTALPQGDQYLSFFHSSKTLQTVHSNGKPLPHYVMGAYMFANKPPFEITRISPSPIVGNNFYSPPPYKTWKPLRVVFPGGFIMDENHIWVVYGRQDFESWVVKLDKKALLKSLIPVTTILWE